VNPAITLFKLGDFHELEGLQEQILARRSEELGDGDPSTRPSFVALIKTKHTLGKREDGIRQEKLWLEGATRRLRGKFRGTSEEELD
jgi:hypothetical protein